MTVRCLSCVFPGVIAGRESAIVPRSDTLCATLVTKWAEYVAFGGL
jgi:hypothetical protein